MLDKQFLETIKTGENLSSSIARIKKDFSKIDSVQIVGNISQEKLNDKIKEMEDSIYNLAKWSMRGITVDGKFERNISDEEVPYIHNYSTFVSQLQGHMINLGKLEILDKTQIEQKLDEIDSDKGAQQGAAKESYALNFSSYIIDQLLNVERVAQEFESKNLDVKEFALVQTQKIRNTFNKMKEDFELYPEFEESINAIINDYLAKFSEGMEEVQETDQMLNLDKVQIMNDSNVVTCLNETNKEIERLRKKSAKLAENSEGRVDEINLDNLHRGIQDTYYSVEKIGTRNWLRACSQEANINVNKFERYVKVLGEKVSNALDRDYYNLRQAKDLVHDIGVLSERVITTSSDIFNNEFKARMTQTNNQVENLNELVSNMPKDLAEKFAKAITTQVEYSKNKNNYLAERAESEIDEKVEKQYNNLIDKIDELNEIIENQSASSKE